MALSELELKKIENAGKQYLEKNRPPVHLRDQVDLAFRIDKQSVEVMAGHVKLENPFTNHSLLP